jgi:hypothetical protein
MMIGQMYERHGKGVQEKEEEERYKRDKGRNGFPQETKHIHVLKCHIQIAEYPEILLWVISTSPGKYQDGIINYITASLFHIQQ